MAGIGEVAIRVAHHLLGTVIVVLDGDVDRHARRLPHVLSVRRCPRRGNGRRSLPAPPGRRPLSRLRRRDREHPAQQPDQRHVCPPDPVLVQRVDHQHAERVRPGGPAGGDPRRAGFTPRALRPNSGRRCIRMRLHVSDSLKGRGHARISPSAQGYGRGGYVSERTGERIGEARTTRATTPRQGS